MHSHPPQVRLSNRRSPTRTQTDLLVLSHTFPSAPFLLNSLVSDRYDHRKSNSEAIAMGYAVAWLLGVPVTVLAIWFIVTHI
jgi:hypothetical protein